MVRRVREPPAIEPFGAEVDAEHITQAGVRIAGDGLVGWGWNTPRWADGKFFRYAVTEVHPIPAR